VTYTALHVVPADDDGPAGVEISGEPGTFPPSITEGWALGNVVKAGLQPAVDADAVCSHSVCLSHTRKHTHTHTHKRTHTFTLSISHALSLSHSHTLTHLPQPRTSTIQSFHFARNRTRKVVRKRESAK